MGYAGKHRGNPALWCSNAEIPRIAVTTFLLSQEAKRLRAGGLAPCYKIPAICG